MASRTQPTKILLDVEDCVSELKNQSLDGKTPINDDFTTLHRFQEKLELLLSLGLIEKPGLLSQKKSYWNYICACFASSKRCHDGINFVKSLAALKTSLGRGRAFIRFCLAQKCLADTLQSCFMEQKISRDFYIERSLPVQENLWSKLVSSLYELNELNFDLSAGYTELDISWPKFARKLFTSSGNESFPVRNFSTPNLSSISTQDEQNPGKCDSDSCCSLDVYSSSYNSGVENLDPLKMNELNEELYQQNIYLQKEVNDLKGEKLKLQSDIQALQKEYLSLQQQFDSCQKDHTKTKIRDDCEEIDCGDATVSPLTATVGINTKESAEKKAELIAEKKNENDELLLSASLFVKPKINSDMVDNSECALQLNSSETSVLKLSNNCACGKRNETTEVNSNIYLPQNSIYITELLLEIKTVIDDIEDTVQKSDVNLVIPLVSRLRRIRNCLDEKFSSECDKSNSYLNFNNFVENCVACIKNLATKQVDTINSLQEKVDSSITGNQTLYSKIGMLKDLLRSYGFLKVGNEKEIQPKSVLLPIEDVPSNSSKFYDDLTCDIAHDPVLKRIIVPLLPVLNSTFKKLNGLNEKMIELQFGLDLSQELNDNLIARVQDQEMHLKGVSKEIEEAQQLVSVLKKQHRKLQSAEGILKYDLQEKRKLLNRLKQQLENTREDFNLVRIKNSKSEAEWQDLRKEFVQRHKQTSEESGFIDDKGLEDHETVFSTVACDCTFSEESTSEKDSVNDNPTEMIQDVAPKKSRLEILEEQCQNLYSSLLQGSKKRQDIDKRLELICKTVEKTNEIMHSSSLNCDLPTGSSFSNASDPIVQTSSEDICQNMIFTPDTSTNSPHSSSDVGSLNSECSSCMPSICNDANSSDSCFCDSSKVDSCISFPQRKLQNGAIQYLTSNVQLNDSNVFPESVSASGYKAECKVTNETIPSPESNEMPGSQDLNTQTISHVDSILIKKKDLEESLKILEIDNETDASDKKYLSTEEFARQVSVLKEEKLQLLSKVQELEKRTLIISAELDRTTQQLIVSKAAKDHEVAALQFQLNTEALKYERALKEFSDQSKGLESMKQRVNDQEKLILALEEALMEIRSDRENEKEHQWQESMNEVAEEQNKNEVLLSQLEEVKAYNQKDRENMESEILLLKTYSRELQKKLVKLLKEKDILWKRSNHLYHLQKIKIDDRWMNDSEVSRCLGCKNNFSFMLRKHHCRLCGRIFCYSCSNNWLMTASSSKKLRACNECFMQHIEVKKVVRRGSGVPQVEDESDDEASCNLSYLPASNCSFNSEIPSSITDSVISLPITQKLSTPHFASAPDLRYAFKLDEVSSSCSVSLAEAHSEIKEEKMPFFDDNNLSDQNTEISSDECTSITLEEDSPKPCRLKEISLDEIEASKDGFNGEFVIQAGGKGDLLISCETCPSVLKWNFISNCQEIPVKITFNKDLCDKNSSIYYQASNKMQDEINLTNPGYYVFHFDNTTREVDLEMKYSISATYESKHLGHQ